MAQYKSPGLYTEIKGSMGVRPIGGVEASILGTTGWLKKGPVGQPTLISSWSEFERVFGGLWKKSLAPYEILAFFNSGGAKAYVTREVPQDATEATAQVESSSYAAVFYGRELPDPVTSLDASHYNIVVNVDGHGDTTIDVTGDNGAAGTYALSTIVENINNALAAVDPSLSNVCSAVAWSSGKYRLVFTSPTSGATSSIVFSQASSNDCSKELLGLTSLPHSEYGYSPADRWDFQAANPGAWANGWILKLVGHDDYQDSNGSWTKFLVYVIDEDGETQEVLGPVSLTDSNASDYILDVVNEDSEQVRVSAGANPGVPFELQAVQVTSEYLETGDGATTQFSGKLAWGRVVPGSLSISDGTETFTDNGDGTLSGSAGGAGTVNYGTGEYSVTFNAAPSSGADITASYTVRSYGLESSSALAGGADGTGPLTRSHLTDPTLKATNRGIWALRSVDEILVVSVADMAGNALSYQDLLSSDEVTSGKWFVLIDPPDGYGAQETVDWVRNTGAFNSRYAAVYAPWTKIADPLANGRAYTIPPSGMVAARYAYTDGNRNVGKAPAGMIDGQLPFCIGLAQKFTQAERDVLYSGRVNPLVENAQVGRAVWGARTVSLDQDFRYVNASRLAMFLKWSLWKAMHWTVFENNGPGLWARMRASAEGFLTTLHRQGYFAGRTPAESFLVVCDESINTPADVNQGIAKMQVAFAPNKPAEFVVIELWFKTAEA